MRYFLNKSLFPVLSAVLVFSVYVLCPQLASAQKSEPLPDLTRARVVVAPGAKLKKTSGRMNQVRIRLRDLLILPRSCWRRMPQKIPAKKA